MAEKEEPIRVAQIMGYMNGAGVEAVVTNYYKYIDKNKIQFDFICCEGSTNIPYNEIESQGGRVILIPPYKKMLSYQKELKKVLKNGKYKIVHSHVNALSVFSLFAAKRAGVPIRIAHSHSSSNKKEKTRNIIKNILKLFSKTFATDYMACSELAGRWLFGNKAFDEGKVKILNNAIDLEKFEYNEKIRKAKRKELGIKDDTLVIGHIGRFMKQKNHSFLIDIFDEVHKKQPNSILLLAGQGPLIDDIKEKVNFLGLTDSVKFLGQRQDVNELYQAMDVFLLPSLYEGLPVVGIEAQASGLLCVFSDDMTKETKVLDTTTFLNLRENPEKWSKKIIELYKNYKRHNTIYELSNYGFNIRQEHIRLEDEYLKKNRIKICHIVSGLNNGGVESVIYNYCTKMDDRKFEFHILYQHKPDLKCIEKFQKGKFILQRIPSKKINPLGNYYKTKKYFKKNNIDIVHCHMTLMNYIPLLAANKTNINIRISHSHNSFPMSKNKLKNLLVKLLKKQIYKLSTCNIACGYEAGKFLYGNNHFFILNNAIDVNKYKYNEDDKISIKKIYNIENYKIIGHVGRFTEQKNHEFLIEVFEKLIKVDESYRLILIGDGENKDKIIKLVNEMKINDKVIFVGSVTDTFKFYSSFDWFLLPSIWEGFPVVGLEAQACNVNCIFSSNIDKKIVINDNVYLMNIEDSDQWVNIIINKDNKEYQFNKNKMLCSKYDINTEYKKLEKIYLGEKYD